MIKRMNRRGAVESDTLILLVLGFLVVVVVAISLTTGWGFVSNFFTQSNVNVAVMSEKCGALSTNPSGFCVDKLEIKKNNYYNCPYAIRTIGVQVASPPTTPCTDAEKLMCNKLKVETTNFNPENVFVNDKPCGYYLITSTEIAKTYCTGASNQKVTYYEGDEKVEKTAKVCECEAVTPATTPATYKCKGS